MSRDTAPITGCDGVFFDLDGVLYAGEAAIPHAVAGVRELGSGCAIGYLTNNASRSDVTVAGHLARLGFPAAAEQVITSPQAAVRLLRDEVPAGSRILVIGGEGIVVELERAGFTVTRSATEHPAAVVQGFAPDVGWVQLAEASFALADGSVPWVATNTDWTIPVARGVAPGNGTLVAAVHSAVGRLPVVAGKPEPTMFTLAAERLGVRRPIMVGDRLDTDIRGAKAAGMPAALVLTGIDRTRAVLAARDGDRPDYLLRDVRGLREAYPVVQRKRDGSAAVRDARVRIAGHTVEIVRRGTDPLDTLRAACAAIWSSTLGIHALSVPEELLAEPTEP